MFADTNDQLVLIGSSGCNHQYKPFCDWLTLIERTRHPSFITFILGGIIKFSSVVYYDAITNMENAKETIVIGYLNSHWGINITSVGICTNVNIRKEGRKCFI